MDLLTELAKKNRLEPWDHRTNKSAAIEDIDLVALREYLQEMKLWSDKKRSTIIYLQGSR